MIANEREAIETLIRNGIDADSNDKVILFSPRPVGLRLRAAYDYLKNHCNYNHLNQTTTESYLKAKRIQRRKSK